MPVQIIKKRRDFLAAGASGHKWITGSFILLAAERAEAHPAGNISRVGFTVTKKMGNAVCRNRIKRRLREALRTCPPAMRERWDYVIISRNKALDTSFAELNRDIAFAFSRIHANKVRPGTK